MNKVILLVFIFKACACLANDPFSVLEQKINSTYEKKAEVDLALAKADEEVHGFETLIREKRKILLERVRALSYLKDYKWGGLFAVDDPNQFERNLKILSKLNSYDLALFKDYKSALRNLSQGRQDLVIFRKELESIITDLKAQEQVLDDKQQKLTKSLALENKKSLLLFKGKMPAPTEGQLKWSFGSQRDEQNQYALLIHGLLYSTRPQQKVRAVGPGKVIFRDAIPYWGETLIVQHDDNYYSIYAGIQNLATLPDQVAMNDVIATTRSQEFYFELRHFETPIDPKLWLRDIL